MKCYSGIAHAISKGACDCGHNSCLSKNNLQSASNASSQAKMNNFDSEICSCGAFGILE